MHFQLPTLSEEQMKSIHDTGMEILEKIGIKTYSEVISEIGNRDGIKVHGGRLFFSRSLTEKMVNDYLTDRDKVRERTEPKELTFGLPGCLAHNYMKIGQREIRPLESKDIVELVKASDVLADEEPMIRGVASGLACDVPAPLRTLYANKVSAQYHSKGNLPRGYSSIEDADLVFAMQEVLGQDIHIGIHLPSPLEFEGNEVDVALKFRNRAKSWGVSSIPMGGATAPIDLFGNMAQNVAEIWGGYIIMKLLEPEKPAGIAMVSNAFDMQSGNLDYGTYRAVLMWLCTHQMNKFYKSENELGVYAFNVSYCQPCTAQGVYSTSVLLPAMLLGARNFGMGLMGIDNIFSWEKTFYDIETMKFCESLLQPVVSSKTEEIIRTIQDVIEGGESYLTHPSTLEALRKDWRPKFLRSIPVQDFENQKGSILEQMRDRKEHLLEKHSYVLEDGQFKEIENIYNKGIRLLQN